MANDHNHIVFYDGTCPLCHRIVIWALKRELTVPLYFAPLEGETAQKIMGTAWSSFRALDTVVFYTDSIFYVKSDAVVVLLQKTKGYQWLSSAMRIVPKSWRDPIYDLIARHRKKIWKTCPVIPEKYRSQILP